MDQYGLITIGFRIIFTIWSVRLQLSPHNVIGAYWQDWTAVTGLQNQHNTTIWNRHDWWGWEDSNFWPSALHADTLPTELQPHKLAEGERIELSRRINTRLFSRQFPSPAIGLTFHKLVLLIRFEQMTDALSRHCSTNWAIVVLDSYEWFEHSTSTLGT